MWPVYTFMLFHFSFSQYARTPPVMTERAYDGIFKYRKFKSGETAIGVRYMPVLYPVLHCLNMRASRLLRQSAPFEVLKCEK